MASPEIDVNQSFLDTTDEAVQLEFAIIEKAVGFDMLTAAADEKAIEDSALDQLSEDEWGVLLRHLDEPLVLDKPETESDYWKVLFLSVAAMHLAEEGLRKLRGFSIITFRLGQLVLEQSEILDELRVTNTIDVRGNGIKTGLVQYMGVHEFGIGGYRGGVVMSEIPRIPLSEINEYLRDFTFSQKRLLELAPQQLKEKLETEAAR